MPLVRVILQMPPYKEEQHFQSVERDFGRRLGCSLNRRKCLAQECALLVKIECAEEGWFQVAENLGVCKLTEYAARQYVPLEHLPTQSGPYSLAPRRYLRSALKSR